MAYDITHKNSTVAGTPPTASEIELGEIAINAADAELYLKDTAGNVKKIANTDTTGTAAGVQFTQTGTQAKQRTVESKLQDLISALDFIPAGTNTSTTDCAGYIQAALDTGRSVYLPNGVYRLNSPIVLRFTGQRLIGENQHSTYLTSAASATHDLLRVANTLCEVSQIHFRPGTGAYSDASPPAFACIRIYQAFANINNCRFLSADDGSGCAIFCDDVDPATGAVIAGAYTHTIANNNIGATGFSFLYGIYCHNLNNGQQATKFIGNFIWGDIGIRVNKGGGNVYANNLLQSATGTYTTGAGNGIDLQADVTGETIFANYIERYQHGIILRRTVDTAWGGDIFGNHWDNNTSNITSLGIKNYSFWNYTNKQASTNAWVWDYLDAALTLKNRTAGASIISFNDAARSAEPRVLAFPDLESLSFTANGQTQTPTSSFVNITGAGIARTGCFLGNGTRNGQTLTATGFTWAVQILNNPSGTQNIVFAGNAASATFGNGAGQVISMQLIWNAAQSTWFELSRVVV